MRFSLWKETLFSVFISSEIMEKLFNYANTRKEGKRKIIPLFLSPPNKSSACSGHWRTHMQAMVSVAK